MEERGNAVIRNKKLFNTSKGGRMPKENPKNVIPPGQTIKQILDLLEATGSQSLVVQKVRKLCWLIVDACKAVQDE